MADRFADDELFEVEVDHDFVSANNERCSVSVDVLHLHTNTSLGSEHLKHRLATGQKDQQYRLGTDELVQRLWSTLNPL
jgi:hypothetical protein